MKRKYKNDLDEHPPESDFSQILKVAIIAFGALLLLGIIITALSIQLAGIRF